MPHLAVHKSRQSAAHRKALARAAAANHPKALILAEELAAKVDELEKLAGDAWENGQLDRSLGITASIEVIRQLFRIH